MPAGDAPSETDSLPHNAVRLGPASETLDPSYDESKDPS